MIIELFVVAAVVFQFGVFITEDIKRGAPEKSFLFVFGLIFWFFVYRFFAYRIKRRDKNK